MDLPAYIIEEPGRVVLSLKVQPRASKNEIGDALGSELRVRVCAPPVDAAANEALVKLLAAHLGCPKRAVQILRGHTSRHKAVTILGLSARDLLVRLRPE